MLADMIFWRVLSLCDCFFCYGLICGFEYITEEFKCFCAPILLAGGVFQNVLAVAGGWQGRWIKI